jgi:hypothetical protein
MKILVPGKWMGTDLVDMQGKSYAVGDIVARGVKSGYAVSIEIVEVTRIEDDKIYVGGSKVPIKYPQRLLIVTGFYKL